MSDVRSRLRRTDFFTRRLPGARGSRAAAGGRGAAALLLAMAACGAPTGSAVAPAAGARISFEDGVLGQPPAGWHVARAAGTDRAGSWSVERVDGAPDGAHAVAVVATGGTGSTFNLLLSDAPQPGDVTVSVQLRARSGVLDQGGGLVWRARDADHYYIARWNPLEDNLRLYKVEAGERTTFASHTLHADPAAWHRLTVTMRGARITVAFDGKEVLRHSDPTFPDGGRVGLWTKADASTQFDLLEITPLAR